FGLVRNNITISTTTADEVINFIVDNSDEFTSSTPPTPSDEVQFDDLFGSVSFSKDTRNRRIFASQGYLNSISLEIFSGDLDFYKIRYLHRSAFALSENITLAYRARIGFGDRYNKTTDLPFFEKFTSGGIRSVRGYDRNSLGPLDSQGNPFGGNLQVSTTVEILIPVESLGSSETFRLGVYFDAGNVFADVNSFQSREIRQSVGLSAKWFSIIGPLEFSYAFPLNDEPSDDIRQFQFALGATF
ncbi:MAG: BamA/TamA family outer membrane protein, partial [Gammaproteobacteria bacterium]